MSQMVKKAYSAEFKADAVALYLSDLRNTFEGESATTWASATRRCASECQRTGTRTPDRRTSGPERQRGEVSSDSVLEEENKQLRAQIRKLETEREILRRAAKYFAGETNW